MYIDRQSECLSAYKICTCQIKFIPLQAKLNTKNMENYTVTISFTHSMSVEFQAKNIGCSVKNGLALARFNEFEILSDKGFLFINFDTMKVSFSYDIFSFEWEVTEYKETDGHYFVKCTNGSNVIDIELTDPC